MNYVEMANELTVNRRLRLSMAQTLLIMADETGTGDYGDFAVIRTGADYVIRENGAEETVTAPAPEAPVKITTGEMLQDRMYAAGPDNWESVINNATNAAVLSAVDLCGIDSEGMTRKAATRALLKSFG